MQTIRIRSHVGSDGSLQIQLNNLPSDRDLEIVLVYQLISEEVESHLPITENQGLTLEQRLAFLKLPMCDRRAILASQAEELLTYYQQESDWKELMAGDIVDY
jgi:hypothetical protein